MWNRFCLSNSVLYFMSTVRKTTNRLTRLIIVHVSGTEHAILHTECPLDNDNFSFSFSFACCSVKRIE